MKQKSTTVQGSPRAFPVSLIFEQHVSTTEMEKVSPLLHGQLYTKFKEAHHNNWQEILEIHNMLELSESSSSTVAQRTQTFNKIWRQAMSLISPSPAFLNYTNLHLA